MDDPTPDDADLASDVELDLLLLRARNTARGALAGTLDLAAGIAAIRARHGPGAASRPPPVRTGPSDRFPHGLPRANQLIRDPLTDDQLTLDRHPPESEGQLP